MTGSRWRGGVALLLALVAACADPGRPAEPGPPATLEPVSPQDFTFAAGPEAVAALVVRVRDADGRPVPEATVRWSDESHRVDPTESLTDDRGEARATWRLGTRATGTLPARAEATVVTAQGTRVIGFSARVEPGPVVVATVIRADTLPRRTGIVLEVGQRVRFQTFGRDAGDNVVVGAPATWSTSDPARATADAGGVVTALRQGAIRVMGAIPTASIVPFGNALVVDPLRARDVAVGESWSCALAPAGTVECWGARFTAAFMPVDSVVEPRRVAPALRFAALRGARTLACALAADADAVWCWRGRQTGVEPAPPVVPARALSGGPLTAIAVGDALVCGLEATGAARCAPVSAGGDGTADVAVGPERRVVGAPPLRAIAASDTTACGAADDGVWCWTIGAGELRPAARLAGSVRATDVELSESRICQLDATGQALCVARGAAPTVAWTAPFPTPVRRLAVGGYATCGVTADARLLCAGANASGVLQRRDFDPVPAVLDAPSPDGSGWAAVSITDDVLPPGILGVAAVAHACGVTGAGRTYCWGGNTRAQLGVPNEHACGTRPSVPCSATPLPVPSVTSGAAALRTAAR